MINSILHSSSLPITLLGIFKPATEIPLGFTSAIFFGMLLCLAISAICSSSENAFFSHRESDLDAYSENGNPQQLRILKLISNPKRLLATILLMNSLANIAFIISSLFFYDLVLNNEEFPWLKLLIDTLFVTLIILIFGEVIPKVYATKNYRKTAEWLTYPMLFFVWILWPFTTLLERLGMVLERNTKSNSPNVTTEEINRAIDLATTEFNGDTDHEKDILKGIVNMSHTVVRQIMVSRMDVVALSNTWSYTEVLSQIREHGYSRMPVYNDTLDSVKGVLNVKSLLPHLNENEDFRWQDLVYPPYFVPENKAIDDLLNEFQHKRLHMAIVADEFGGTSGIVTLEDLLEEVFGELKDEFDDEAPDYEQVNENVFIFEGKSLLVDFIREMELPSDFFASMELDSDTLAGFMTEHLGKIPKRGDKINLQFLQFVVEQADPKKVRKIKIIKNEA